MGFLGKESTRLVDLFLLPYYRLFGTKNNTLIFLLPFSRLRGCAAAHASHAPYPLSLPGREPPLLGVDSDVWYKSRREPGDLAKASLFAFLRGSI